MAEHKPVKDEKAPIWRFVRKLAVIYLLSLSAVVLALGVFGYFAAGWEGAKNAALLGLLLGSLGAPLMGAFVLARFWGDYAGRWGEAEFKKQLEGEHEKPEDKW